jgi:hypothetical protein
MLKKGANVLLIWTTINFILAALILALVVVFDNDSPLLAMVFEPAEIASLDARVIEALNTLTILYNSCSIVVSVLVWLVVRRNLVSGQRWAFWALLGVIGFVELMAWIASVGVDNARWQVNAVQSGLYLLGIGLAGAGLLREEK